jgi:general secretion pathway protein J
LAALSALLSGGLRFGARSWERSQEAEAGISDVAVIQGFLRRALSQSEPVLIISDDGDRRPYFEGGSDHLQFMARAPAARNPGGRARFAVAVTLKEGRGELQVSSRFELGTDQFDSEVTDTVLLRGIQYLEFAYFGADTPAHPPRWQETWLDRDTLPELVRIRVRFPPDDRRTWLDLVVAPEITVDATCLYDPVTRHCRGR